MEYLILKYAHIMGLVYWLGGDLGTFFASNQTINRDNSPEARAVAIKIMLACDQGPKMAMPLMFPLGLHMASISGLVNLASWVLPVVWLIGVLWFANVIFLYMKEGHPSTARLKEIDFWFRIAVVIILVTYAIIGLTRPDVIGADWLAWKILIFAGLVACGIMIRINLKPYIPAFGRLMTEGPSNEVNDTLESSLKRCRPYVWLIWLGLFLEAALGVHLI